MKGIMKALACITLILYFLSACNNHISFADLPDIRLFYCSSEESMSNIPRIYNIKTGESEKITIEGYEDIYISDACGYSDGEFFAFFETKDECKILKVRSGEVIASHDFEAEYKAPESWEYACRSILAIERYKDGVLVLSPSVDPYTDEPFYADIPSTLYYIDFNGLCEPIIENVISFKVYKDKICYSTFDETRLVEYGNTTIYSRFNISIYENGESCELISSENCPYKSIEDWCSENELLLIKDKSIVKYNIESGEETLLLKPEFYYMFEEGKTLYISDRYILACTMKQNVFALNSDVSYLYLFDTQTNRRTVISENLTGTYDAPFEII